MSNTSNSNMSYARLTLKLLLLPAIIYPFAIPFTPYWADIVYVVFCAVLFFIAHTVREKRGIKRDGVKAK